MLQLLYNKIQLILYLLVNKSLIILLTQVY